MALIFPLIVLALLVVALVDVITRPDDQVKHLPKFVWIILIALLPLVGGILWFTVGRDWNTTRREHLSFGDPRRWSSDAAPTPPPAQQRDTRSTEQQLADLEREMRIAELEEQVRRRREAGSDAD